MSNLISESSATFEKAIDEVDRTSWSNKDGSDTANQKVSENRKKKGSVSSERKSHRSSKSSRKTKNVQKKVDARNHKERRNIDRLCSTENQTSVSLHSHVNDEFNSDDPNSSVSDTNTQLHVTRSRIRRLERRKAYSSHSSVADSDHRKTKSEPIIITLSDSDDNASVLSRRPNRTARIRGELIRKLSGTSTKISNYRVHRDSSSSSEYESSKRKKKPKPKSIKTSSLQASKKKKYLKLSLACQSRLNLRKHRKRHIAVYRPLKKKKVLKSINKQCEDQKTEKSSKNMTTSSKKSQQNVPCIQKRSLRSASTDTAVENELKSESQLYPVKNEFKEIKETTIVDNFQILSDSSEMKEHKLEDIKVNIQSEEIGSKTEKDLNPKSVENPKNVENPIEEQKYSKSDTEEDINMELLKADGDKDVQHTPLKQEIMNSPLKKSLVINQPLDKVKKLKKKIKPVDKIARKRGRPRLTEVNKALKEIPVLNDMIQIPFLQSSFCFNVAPKLTKCRECRMAVNRSSRTMLSAYCRFMEYRKLCYNRNGVIQNAGFSEPSDATNEHLNQWLPQLDNPPKDLNSDTSKALVEHIGDQFCDLIDQEKEALSLHIGKDRVITWKRIVQGVREMCDVCYTTLFNIHWVCPICGLAVCIDCYKCRKQGIVVEYDEDQPKNRDQYNWLVCNLRQPHELEKLVITQIIPGNALWTMRDLLHKARKKWNIPSYCKCNPQESLIPNKYISTGICKQLMSFVTKSFSTGKSESQDKNNSDIQNSDCNYDDLDIEVTGTALKWLESSACENGLENLRQNDEYFNSHEDFASLRGNLLIGIQDEDIHSNYEREFTSFSLDDIIECVKNTSKVDDKENSGKQVLKHFSNRYPQANSGRDPLPIRIYTKVESNLAFSDVPHSWFCNGRLLFLLTANHKDNLALFQEQWKRGQPILVKGVDERLHMDLWHPNAFCRDFGEERNDLVDCKTGVLLKNLPMRKFWEGFESFSKRLVDDSGEYMLLKLKDWPPGEDFSEMLPNRFKDLMQGLPLPEYTHRDGVLNLAGRLPPWFVRPDLGPKMYNAYGSALFPSKGTTNLHLDVSDAVNVMVYVGIPSDGNAQLHIDEALKAIDEGGCDSLMRARVRNRGSKPGALWHIYNARDADKIRDLLTKVAIEKGEKLEAHHDPIHDQSWYLDAELRKRLYRDYGVEGYAIAQCLGDAVFIPAGAPHQVRNLHSCVKVAEDFVSPENIAHCFKLTQEFRHLSDTHTNHEDKLQIKNIIYHVVRDALAYLLSDAEAAES